MGLMDFLRDGAWQAAGAILAVAVAFLIYFLQKQRKELSFGVLSSRNLLTVAEEVAQRVQVTFDGAPIANLHVVVAGLKNSGDKPILTSDFERSLFIQVAGKGTVLSVEPIKQNPSNLNASAAISGDQIELLPLLLNPGDHLVLKILYAGSTPKVTCAARIIGISEVAPLNRGIRFGPSEKRELISGLLRFVILGSALFGANRYFSKPIEEFSWLLYVFIAVLLVASTWQWFGGHITNSHRRYIDDA